MKLFGVKSFRLLMKAFLTLASAFTIISINTTCMGPGYQPKLPDAAKRLKRDYSCK